MGGVSLKSNHKNPLIFSKTPWEWLFYLFIYCLAFFFFLNSYSGKFHAFTEIKIVLRVATPPLQFQEFATFWANHILFQCLPITHSLPSIGYFETNPNHYIMSCINIWVRIWRAILTVEIQLSGHDWVKQREIPVVEAVSRF